MKAKIALLGFLNAGLATIIFILVKEYVSQWRMGVHNWVFNQILVVGTVSLLLVYFVTMMVKAWRGEDWPKG